MKKDKDMKRGNVDFQNANNMVAVKWFGNRGVTMVGTCLGECNKVSAFTRKVKGQSAKISVLCPEIIKDYNCGMGGVDLPVQKTTAYKLDRKSSGDPMDISVLSLEPIIVHKGTGTARLKNYFG